MSRRRRIYEGKAKTLFEGPEPGTIVQYFKDDATAFNNQKKGTITGKGVINNRISEFLMTKLGEIGVPTHFIRRLNMREQLIRQVEIIPLEVVVRNVAAGSFAKRFGVEEGTQLPRSIMEFFYKNDQLGDPMVTEEHITAFGWATPQDLDDIVALTLRVNDFLFGLFLGCGIKLIDFKIEFGRLYEDDMVRIVLADEISPNSCRLWDLRTNEKMDKDRFRRDLGKVEEAYQEVARRLGILIDQGPGDVRGPTTNARSNKRRNESQSSRDPQERRARPPGQGHRTFPQSPGLPRGGRRPPGQVHRARARRDRQGKGQGPPRGHVPQAPRQHGDRELLDRAGRLMKAAVLVFPGSNREGDVAQAIELVTGRKPQMVWHGDGDFEKTDLIVLPGGFSYGDYLRCGAMAAQSPVMAEVKKRAAQGVPVLAICNGFQIAAEAGLVPGVLMRNEKLKFVCGDVHLKVETSQSLFTNRYQAGQVIKVPVAHAEGNYFADADTLKRLEDRGQVAFRYCAPDGTVDGTGNPNGSIQNIAGVFNETKTVMGLMPHPENAVESLFGGCDGKALFEGLVEALA